MSKGNQNLQQLFYPWTFILKEGKRIEKDRLDYSLMMLQVGRTEILKSPKGSSKKSRR